jgi:hypothetical protein
VISQEVRTDAWGSLQPWARTQGWQRNLDDFWQVCSEYMHRGGFLDTPIRQLPVDSRAAPFVGEASLRSALCVTTADVDAGTAPTGSLVECSLRRLMSLKAADERIVGG